MFSLAAASFLVILTTLMSSMESRCFAGITGDGRGSQDDDSLRSPTISDEFKVFETRRDTLLEGNVSPCASGSYSA